MIYQNVNQSGKDLYAKYEPSSTEETTPNKKLSICSLYDNARIRMAIDKYKKDHKDVEIEWNVTIPQEDSRMIVDGVKTINTEILTGNASDILLLDDLPADAYIEKGVFMDISDLFITSDQNNKILKNISDYYTKENKIYYMPMRVFMPVYGMHEDISEYTNSVEDLANYCEGKDTPLFYDYNYYYLANLFCSSYWEEIFLNDGQINKEGYTSFLQSLSRIAKQVGATYAEGGADHSMSFNAFTLSNYSIEGIYTGNPNLLMWDDCTICFR